jgi:hypothetical protein
MKVMKGVLFILSVVLLGSGCILLMGDNGLGYVSAVLGLSGFYYIDKKYILGE